MNIVIAGKNNIAVYALYYLLEKYSNQYLAVVINATDEGEDDWQLSLKKFAIEVGVKIIDLPETERWADVFISLEYDKIVKPVNFKTKFLFNIHFSRLPAYKGMYTSILPILNCDTCTGVTLHEIDLGIDTGAIIDQLEFDVSENMTSKDLYLKYIDNAILLFEKNVEALLAMSYSTCNQNARGSSYYSKESLNLRVCSIDLNQTAWFIGRQIRSYSFRNYQLPCVLKHSVVNYEILSSRSKEKTKTILFEDEQSLIISTVDYDIRLFKDRSRELFEACEKGYFIFIQKNLYNLPSIDDRNNRSWSLLMVASYFGWLDIVKYLIGAGADVNAINYKGTSVLMYAKDDSLRSNDLELFKYLLSKGADVNHKDFHGKSILDYVTDMQAAFLGLN